MHNNANYGYREDSSWDMISAEKAKKFTLGLIGISIINFLLRLLDIFTMTAEKYIEILNMSGIKVVGSPAALEANYSRIRIMQVVFVVIIFLIIIGLLWAKIKKLDEKIVPSRGIYFFLLLVSAFGALAILSPSTYESITGILALIMSILTLALSLLAIMAIGVLRRNFVMSNNNMADRSQAYYNNQPMKDDMNNSATPVTVVNNMPERIEPNYNSNQTNQTYQEMIPNHQPVNNLDRNQLLDVEPIVPEMTSGNENNIPANEDPGSSL